LIGSDRSRFGRSCQAIFGLSRENPGDLRESLRRRRLGLESSGRNPAEQTLWCPASPFWLEAGGRRLRRGSSLRIGGTGVQVPMNRPAIQFPFVKSTRRTGLRPPARRPWILRVRGSRRAGTRDASPWRAPSPGTFDSLHFTSCAECNLALAARPRVGHIGRTGDVAEWLKAAVC
jgi:hypothetical protein